MKNERATFVKNLFKKFPLLLIQAFPHPISSLYLNIRSVLGGHLSLESPSFVDHFQILRRLNLNIHYTSCLNIS